MTTLYITLKMIGLVLVSAYIGYTYGTSKNEIRMTFKFLEHLEDRGIIKIDRKKLFEGAINATGDDS